MARPALLLGLLCIAASRSLPSLLTMTVAISEVLIFFITSGIPVP